MKMCTAYPSCSRKESFGKAPIRRVELSSIQIDPILTDKTGKNIGIRISFQKGVKRAHKQLEQLTRLLLLRAR